VTRLAGDPGLLRQAGYAYGFRVPAANQDWLWHELTDAGWRGRMTLRQLVAMLPIAIVLAVVFALLSGSVWLPLTVALFFLIASVGTAALYADDLRVARLRRNGLEPPDDPDLGRPSH
jgi:Flp pilus assembly protein TadB